MVVAAVISILRALAEQYSSSSLLYDTDRSLSRRQHTHCVGYEDSPLGTANIGFLGALDVRVTIVRMEYRNTAVALIVRTIMIMFWSPVTG